MHPTFVILSGTECSEGFQSLHKIGILHFAIAMLLFQSRSSVGVACLKDKQNDICKPGMHSVPSPLCSISLKNLCISDIRQYQRTGIAATLGAFLAGTP
ncbi:MAG: hypothetical protein EA342_02525 [Leptolyngbya sp. LCM1.Bin17]|nr:MAG: hypothetical protein EA342_02525 [Leptolyngbya sp. LCM1.Bin17]